MEDLERTGLIEKSLFIVYGDHGSGLNCVDDIKKLYKENGVEYTEFEDSVKEVHIPFGIKIPGINANNPNERTMKIIWMI